MISRYFYDQLRIMAVRLATLGETRTLYWVEKRCAFRGDDVELLGTYDGKRPLADLLAQMVEDLEEWLRVTPVRVDGVKRRPRPEI